MSITEQVRKKAAQLRLSGLVETLDMRTEAALSSCQHPQDYLHLLLEDELLHRKNKSTQRLISRGRFRLAADIEDWDMSFDRGISKQVLKELALLNFYHNKENLLVFGKTGCGKTHLSVALARRLCYEQISALFFSVNLFFEEVTVQRATGQYLKFISQIAKINVLVFDDFGLRSYTHEEAMTLLDLLEARYRKGILIVTSQVDSKGWFKLFEDPPTAEAIIDRLTKPSHRVVLASESYRNRLGTLRKELASKKPGK